MDDGKQKRVLKKKSELQKSILNRYFESGMTHCRSENRQTILKAAAESGLEYEVVTQWIDNKKKVKKTKTVKDYVRQPSGYDLFRSSKMKEESLNKTNTVNGRWMELGEEERQVLNEEAKAFERPKLEELDDGQKTHRIKKLRDSMYKSSKDLEKLGIESFVIDCNKDGSTHMFGSEKGLDFGQKLNIPQKFNVHLIGEATGHAHVSYKSLGKKFHVHGLPSEFMLKSPSELPLIDLELIDKNLDNIYFTKIPLEAQKGIHREAQKDTNLTSTFISGPVVDQTANSYIKPLYDSLDPIILGPHQSIVKTRRSSSSSSEDSDNDDEDNLSLAALKHTKLS